MITGIQLRAALGLLGWSIADLKRETGLGSTVLNEMKCFDGVKPNAAFKTLEKVRNAIIVGIERERAVLSEKAMPGEVAMFDAVTSPIMRIATTDNSGIQPKGE